MNKKGIFLICVVLLIIISIASVIFFSNKKAKDRDYELLQVNEYKYYALLVDGKYGVIRKDGTVIIEPNYNEVHIPNQDKDIFVVKDNDTYKVFNENKQQLFTDLQSVSAIVGKNEADENIYNTTVLKYMENGKYGLLSFDGKKITKPEYEEMSALTDNYGEILVKQNGKYGVINVKGITLVKPKYDTVAGDAYFENGSFKNSGYIVGNKTNQGMKYGYLDKNEKEIIKVEQETLYRVTEISSNDAYIVASQNGRYALYKNKENLTGYKYINIYYNNNTNSFTVQKNKSYGLINLSGQVIVPEEYEELMVVGIYVEASKNGTNYIYDLNGNQVTDAKFTSLQSTVTGKFYITMDENYRYGIANKEQETVVENKYDYIDEIENTGLMIATIGNDVTIYSGNAVEIVSVNDAKVEMHGDYIEVITKEESYYLTADGKKVDNKTVYIENNLYASKSGNKWGFVDLKDRIIIPYVYDEVTEVNQYGFAGIKQNGKWGSIDKNGNVVVEPTYESDEINPVFIGKYVLKNNIVTNKF